MRPYRLISAIVLLIIILSVKSFYSINKPPALVYVPYLPGDIMAMTIPPGGIFIESKYRNEGSEPGSILAHEMVHWRQYQERGLARFYFEYFTALVKDGRINNRFEVEAREESV